MFLTDRDIVYIHSIDKPAPLTISVRAEKQIIPTHHALAHLPRLMIESPIFQTIASLPSHAIIRILILIPELNRDPIVPESEQLLAQSIVTFALPFCRQKFDNGVCPREEAGTVTPDASWRVGLRHSLGISFAWLMVSWRACLKREICYVISM